MDKMIEEIDTSVAQELAIIAAGLTVIVVAPRVAFALLRRCRNNTPALVSYEEFKNSGDQYARLYTHPSVN